MTNWLWRSPRKCRVFRAIFEEIDESVKRQQVSMDKWTKKKHEEYDPGTLHHRMPKTKKELKN